MGGAIATSYQRCGGQTTSGGSPLAAPSTAASRVAGSSSGSKDCAGLRAATCKPAARRSVRRRAATQVFPTSVPVPTTATTRRGRTPVRGAVRRPCRRAAARGSSVQRVEQPADVLVAVRRRQRDPQPAGADRHGGRADGRDPQALVEQRRRRVERGLLAAEDDRDDRARMSRRREAGLGHPVDQGGEAARQGGALGGAQDAERGERRRGVGRRRRGREDVRAGPVDDQVDDVARTPPRNRRASPVSWTACRPARPFPSVRRPGPGLPSLRPVPVPRGGCGRSGPRTAWASSRTRRAPWRRQRVTSSSRGATSPSMEKTESVTTMVGIRRCGRRRRRRRHRPAAPRGGPCRGGGRRRGPSGRAGSRR